jgi:Ca-activated chloride channel homolog
MPNATPSPARCRPAAVALAVCLLAALLPAAAEAYTKAEQKKIAELPAKYQGWTDEVQVILSEDELTAFLSLDKDYQRDAFIDRFWRARDPFPDTARNEFKEHWDDRVQEAKLEYGNLTEDRARMLLLLGVPDGLLKVRCTPLLYPLEVWYYAHADIVQRELLVIFAQLQGFSRFQLWRPSDGLDKLVDNMNTTPSTTLQEISRTCRDGDKVASAIYFALQDPMDFEKLIGTIQARPKPPAGGEWLATFNAYSTDLLADAKPLPAELKIAFPGRHESRTVVQSTLVVPRAEAGESTLADYHSYDFLVTGEVLADNQLFESFRYKFDLPAGDVAGDSIPLVFERYLRPGDYRFVVKLEDLNGQRFFRSDKPLTVPEVGTAAPPPPPADAETARLLAEANAAIASGETTIKFVQPQKELLTGFYRFETLTTGQSFDKVAFSLDGKLVLTRSSPPWSVDLDLGALPRTHALSVVGYDAGGSQLASDSLQVNAGSHRFRLHLVEPQRGKKYSDSLRAQAEVDTPEGTAPEKVEFYLNETLVATLYQPPWEQPIVLPPDQQVAYVRAVAYLLDGNSTEDLVFVNAPEYLEELNVQFVELYASVVDRDGHPVQGLTRSDFAVSEDGAKQDIVRFEQVRDLPIYTAALIDVSASMDESLADTKNAALSFFQQAVHPKDRAALITFNDRPNLAVKFTHDVDELAGGLAGLKAERGTALYDSLIFALYYFNGIKGQRALLVLSDGKDESSRFSFEQTLEYARRAGVTIYTIALRDDAAHKKLSKLAEATGGRSYLIQKASELAPIYDAIQKELRSQYLIAYQSSNTTDSTDFRSVSLKVDRPGVEVKAIQGYYP